jgi:hypothetical protein
MEGAGGPGRRRLRVTWADEGLQTPDPAPASAVAAVGTSMEGAGGPGRRRPAFWNNGGVSFTAARAREEAEVIANGGGKLLSKCC